MILPSLYAWFNIKAWDPYGNTKKFIAVSNEDAGSNLRGKRYQYRERDCRFSEENKNLGWKFVDENKQFEWNAGITQALQSQKTSQKIATVLDENHETRT